MCANCCKKRLASLETKYYISDAMFGNLFEGSKNDIFPRGIIPFRRGNNSFRTL